MARAVKTSGQPIETDYEPGFEPAGRYESFELGDRAARDARALQSRLFEAYGAQIADPHAEPRFSLRLRLAIVAGSATVLWLLIGAGLFALIG